MPKRFRSMAASLMLVASISLSGCNSDGEKISAPNTSTTEAYPSPIPTPVPSPTPTFTPSPAPSPTLAPTVGQIQFTGVGTAGIFDPSLTFDSTANRIWMSYSAVNPSVMWPTQNPLVISTRLAFSDDQGRSWSDAGMVNPSLDITTALPAPNNAGTWVNEVSRVIYDPYATSAGERWKLLWHHYLIINGTRHFEDGWIGYKTADTALDLAAATERKLFGALGYSVANNTQGGTTGSPVGGAPLISFHNLNTNLSTCSALSEPGLLSTNSALYMSILCPTTGGDHLVVLMKCATPCSVTSATGWQYVTTLLQNSDAMALGYLSYSGTDLFHAPDGDYLIVSPVSNSPVTSAYNGCMIFKFSDISTGTLVSKSSPSQTVTGTSGSFNGACGYDPSASGSGVIYSQLFQNNSELFRIFSSGINVN